MKIIYPKYTVSDIENKKSLIENRIEEVKHSKEFFKNIVTTILAGVGCAILFIGSQYIMLLKIYLKIFTQALKDESLLSVNFGTLWLTYVFNILCCFLMGLGAFVVCTKLYSFIKEKTTGAFKTIKRCEYKLSKLEKYKQQYENVDYLKSCSQPSVQRSHFFKEENGFHVLAKKDGYTRDVYIIVKRRHRDDLCLDGTIDLTVLDKEVNATLAKE